MAASNLLTDKAIRSAVKAATDERTPRKISNGGGLKRQRVITLRHLEQLVDNPAVHAVIANVEKPCRLADFADLG